MAASPTLERSPGDWIGSGSSQLREPAVAAGLPVPAADGAAIAVLARQGHASGRRRFPVRSLSLAVIVLIPVALAIVYYFFIAADQYIAEFRFALRAVEPVRAEMGGIFQGNVAPSPVSVDSYAVVQYLSSRDVIEDLGKNLDLREMFSRPEADWPARLDLPATLRSWSDTGKTKSMRSTTSATARSSFGPAPLRPTTLCASARDPRLAEQLVNDLSARARRDTLRNSEKGSAPRRTAIEERSRAAARVSRPGGHHRSPQDCRRHAGAGR